MAGTNQPDMISDSAEVRLRRGVDVGGSRLTAQQGFVLSRIEGGVSVETLCLITGLGREVTIEILNALSDKGLIRIGPDDTGSSGGEVGGVPEPGSLSGHQAQDWDDDTDTDAEGPAVPAAESDAVEVELLEQEDSDLDLEKRKQIRSVHERLGDMNLFELLGQNPGASEKEVRKAYFIKSKEYHPDRFYNKKLGPYKVMLQDIFKQVRAAYKFLQNEGQRNAYCDMVLEQGEQEALAREVEKQAAEVLRADEADGALDRSDVEEIRYIKGQTFKNRRRKVSVRSDKIRRALVKITKNPAESRKSAKTTKITPADRERWEKRKKSKDHNQRARRVTKTLMSRKRRSEEFYHQGIAQLGKQQYLAASASLKLAVSYDPEHVDAAEAYKEASGKSKELTAENYFKRGIFEESVGRMDAAGNSFIAAADAFPKPTYLQRAAEAMIWCRDLIKAKEYATKAVQTEPNDVENRITLARVYIEAKLWKNARREAQAALKIEPRNSDAKELLKKSSWF